MWPWPALREGRGGGGGVQGRWREQGDAPTSEKLLRVDPAQVSVCEYVCICLHVHVYVSRQDRRQRAFRLASKSFSLNTHTCM